ncbi:MAG TPA: hypothetical protein VFT85_01255 [Acidimicrobiia bacterium]|nr:hypothetical protein [Acidimicrobiia bacterium]
MSVMNGDSPWNPAGLRATIVGGVAGIVLGFGVGMIVAQAATSNLDGGLEVIGTAIMILFLVVAVGAGIGVGVALALSKGSRPVATAALAMPAVVVATIFTLRYSADLAVPLFLIVLGGSLILSLWLARVVVMLPGRNRAEIREE